MGANVEIKAETTKSWIVSISTVISILAVAGGIVQGSFQWVEEAKARQAEIELRAAREFLSTMEWAHGRSSYIWSEECAKWVGTKIESGKYDLTSINRIFEDSCSMRLPVGAATQEAEIQLIADFAIRYPFLRSSAIAGLNSLKKQNINTNVNEAADNALNRISSKK